MSLEHPEFIFCVALVVASVGALRLKGWLAGISRAELFFRSLALLALGVALATPQCEKSDKSSRLAVLLDISDSMDSEQSSRLYSRAETLARSIGVEIDSYPFANKPAEVPALTSSVRIAKTAWGKLDVGATDIERAVESIGFGVSEGSLPVILISDGWETKGNVLRLISEQAGRVRVFPLMPSEAQQRPTVFKISSLDAPLIAAAEKSVKIRASVHNSTDAVQQGVLEITHAGRSIYREEVRVEAGKEFLVVAESDPSQEGIKEITATLTPKDSHFAPSSETVFLSGELRQKVLLLSGSAEDERFLGEVLKRQAYQLSMQGVSTAVDLSQLAGVEAIVLNNIALKQLPTDAASTIAKYVRDGGGLVMIGGSRSFGLGGYRGSEIEEVLPVELLPPQTEQKRLNVAVQLVLDKSRSMAQGERLEFAKEAAKEVVRNLKNDDLIGVIGFDSDAWILVKLTQIGSSRDQVLERIGRLHPAHETNLFPALDEARRSLARASAGRKHIIVLTDGKVPDSGPYYIEYTRQMRLLGITVSTVLIGTDSGDNMLKEMAQVGGGTYYETLDARNLPRIFLQDIKVTSGEKTMREDQEYQVRQGTGQIESTSLRSFPSFNGFVQTKAKSDANLELLAYGADRADPLLVSWKIGEGRSIAFTTDSSGRWTAPWIRWERYGRFFGEVVDAVRGGAAEEAKLQFDLRHSFERGSLLLDVSVFSEKARGEVAGVLVYPDKSEHRVSFREDARGHYTSEVPGVSAGKYEFRGKVGARTLTPVAFQLSGTLFGEKKDQGFNAPLLSTIASDSAGVVNPSADELKDLIAKRIKKIDISNWFLLVALLSCLIEIARRELFRHGFWRRQSKTIVAKFREALIK